MTNYIDPHGVKRDWESAERQVKALQLEHTFNRIHLII
jgi:hypothetical protein